MSIIEQTIHLRGPLGEKDVNALFDSGASVSCIRPELANELEHPMPVPSLRVSTADENHFMIMKEAVLLTFYIREYRFDSNFYLVPGLAEDIIIGATTMQQWRFKLDFENGEVIIDPRVTRMRI